MGLHRGPIRCFDKAKHAGSVRCFGGDKQRSAITQGRSRQIEFFFQLRHAFAVGHQNQVTPGHLVRQRIAQHSALAIDQPVFVRADLVEHVAGRLRRTQDRAVVDIGLVQAQVWKCAPTLTATLRERSVMPSLPVRQASRRVIATLDVAHQHNHIALGPPGQQRLRTLDIAMGQVRNGGGTQQADGQRDHQQRRGQYHRSVSIAGKTIQIDRAFIPKRLSLNSTSSRLTGMHHFIRSREVKEACVGGR